MQVRTIGYGVTRNIGNYENVKVYLEAEVGEGENFKEAYSELKNLVENYSRGHEEIQALGRNKYDLECDISRLENKLKEINNLWKIAGTEWEKAKAFLQLHGVELKSSFPTDPYLTLKGQEALGITVANDDADDDDDDDDDARF